MLICDLSNVLVSVCSESLLILSLIVESLVFYQVPSKAQPFLEESASQVYIVAHVYVTYVEVEGIPFSRCNSSPAISMPQVLIPAVCSMREEQGEVEWHPFWIEI